jgi:glyoxylase-like metal-dependent hydrolase (beta-lactamase superfamily II)
VTSNTYRAGLHELADGTFAYLQPDGSWGWSNAGLITSEGSSLLVDTLFDLALTRQMLDVMRPLTHTRPIDALINTHGNGDHCFGNQLIPENTAIYATHATAEDLREAPPQRLAGLMKTDLGPVLGPYMHRIFGPFHFDDIELRAPDHLFSGTLELTIGHRMASVVEVGPAHTRGDTVVYLPDVGIAFTGDILFIGGTPIMWQGPTANWLRACDTLLGLGAHTFVPGHGPVTDAAGVRQVADYLRYVLAEAERRFHAGMTAEQAADDIELGQFADWSDPERIAVNVETIYRELDSTRPQLPTGQLFERMARWSRRHKRTTAVAREARPTGRPTDDQTDRPSQ